MARIQIVELPMTHIGEATDTPFVVVLDQVDPASSLMTREREHLAELAEQWGARGFLVTADTIEIPANGVPPSPAETFELSVDRAMREGTL